MDNKKKKKRYSNIRYIALMLMLILFSTLLFNVNIYSASAERTEYTNVLEDLQTDSDFDITNYPIVENDYSLKVIQIAESTDNELFVYVYQPEANKSRLATCINMSVEDEEIDTFLYDLDYINSISTLFKYKVKDFTILNKEVRSYNITSIYREFDENIDEKLPEDNDNTIDEVSYPVAKVWTAEEYEGKTIYSCHDVEVIRITDKYVGYVYYPDGFHLFERKSCHSHFIAFSTDKDIDKLLEARVYYASQSYVYNYHYTGFGTPTISRTYGDIKDNIVDLTYTDKTSYISDNLFGVQHTFEWNRIETVSEFTNEVDFDYTYSLGLFNVSTSSKITAEDIDKLSTYQWVLRFAETDYIHTNAGYTQISKETIIGDVSIIELTFETDGEVYNLGVVDNKQSGSGKPINKVNTKIGLEWWVYLLIAFAVLILLYPLLPGVFSFIFKCIGKLFKGIWWVITSPISIFDDDEKET